MEQAIARLNRAKYLFLTSIAEPRDNSLQIVVDEAMADPSALTAPMAADSPLAKILVGAVPVRTTASCHTFELTWQRYIAYLVTEEGAASASSSEESCAGNLFRVCKKSKFLDYVLATTNPIEPVVHYSLICQNHVIDVASYHPPDIRIISESVDSGDKPARPN